MDTSAAAGAGAGAGAAGAAAVQCQSQHFNSKLWLFSFIPAEHESRVQPKQYVCHVSIGTLPVKVLL